MEIVNAEYNITFINSRPTLFSYLLNQILQCLHIAYVHIIGIVLYTTQLEQLL